MASEVTSETRGGGGRVRGWATLMVASEVTSETKGWGGERLCDFDGGF